MILHSVLIGLNFLEGTTIGFELLKSIQEQTSALASYALIVTDETDKCFKTVQKELLGIHSSISPIINRLEVCENNQQEHQMVIDNVSEDVSALTLKTTSAESRLQIGETKLEAIGTEVGETKKVLQNIESNSSKMSDKIDRQNEETRASLTEITENIDELRTDINKLKYNLYTRPEGKAYFYPPDRMTYFVGRKFELEQLQAKYLKKKNEQFTQVICGLGGCGKSTLAVEFSWQFQSLYPGGVFWISAESNEILDTSLSKLAIDVNCVGKDFQETLFGTLKWLSSLETKWLLVIDNVDSEDISGHMKELLLGAWKRGSKGHILVTSRREPKEVENSLLIDQEQCVYLDVLTRREGADFLAKRTGIDYSLEIDTIFDLVDELGGLPLALEQAGAFIKSKRCSFKQYMVRFLKQRQKLLNAMRVTIQGEIGKNRLAVSTTWGLNIEYIETQSEEEGLGTTAVNIMQIASFLYPDDIPIEILNVGLPNIEDKDINDTLQDDLGVKQVVEILTRFSLFQQIGEDTLSVHRLVQEVIREMLTPDKDKTMTILRNATRMINKALESSKSPFEVLSCNLNVKQTDPSLYIWSKLAANASSIKTHISKLPKDLIEATSFLLNLETANMFHASAVFHSIHQRHDEALAHQEQLLNIMTVIDIPQRKCNEYTFVKIPLLERERKLIHDCLSFKSIHNDKANESLISNIPEKLQKLGNEAYKKGRYHDAIHFYTEYVQSIPEENHEMKVLINRGTLYLKVKDCKRALEDAEYCISKEAGNWKGYVLKAQTIAKMVQNDELPPAFEMVGLASASIAAHLNEDCLVRYKMKINYPIVVFKVITCDDNLENCIVDLTDTPHTTLLLRRGHYKMKDPVITKKSFQIVGIEDGVTIRSEYINVTRLPDEAFVIKFKRENCIHAHFENVTFIPGSDQILVANRAIATFYKCKLSNGKQGCDDYPKCSGGKGCIGATPCVRNDEFTPEFANFATGQGGFPGICVTEGGRVIIDNCILDRCGGGGVLACGDDAILEIKHSTIENMRQMGIEARNGGRLIVEDNVITNNQFHGIAVGPRGFAVIRSNVIQGNGQEGIYSGGVLNDDNSPYGGIPRMTSKNASSAVIMDNIIIQNGLSGISLDGGSFEIKGNKIVDNWLWGMMIKSKSSLYLVGNDFFENKCGGIRIGVNYSASVIIDGNTLRDHSGPDIYADIGPSSLLIENYIRKAIPTMNRALAEEPMEYSRPPIITNRNFRRNNNRGVQHPNTAAEVFKACCYCLRSPNDLKKCSRCYIAAYCSQSCQRKHWKSHKYMCNVLQDNYTIKVEMKHTKPHNAKEKMFIWMYHDTVSGVKGGPLPDRKRTIRFIIKVMSGKEYGPFDPQKKLLLYDNSRAIEIVLISPELYHLVIECGVLVGRSISTKTMFCYASFQNNGEILHIHTDNLPPFQTW